jgi:large subunit ribosomal protein L2
MTVASFDEITASKPEKSLTERLKKNGGRNQQGRLTATRAAAISASIA